MGLDSDCLTSNNVPTNSDKLNRLNNRRMSVEMPLSLLLNCRYFVREDGNM